MANEKALKRYMSHTQTAADILADLQAYIDNHGNVAPDDVTYADVGTMAEVAGKLADAMNFASGYDEE